MFNLTPRRQKVGSARRRDSGAKGDAVTLEIIDLSKSYGGILALRQVSLTAPDGEVLAVLGQNGAGKSTLVRILAGVIAPSAGTIMLDGKRAVFDSARTALRGGVVLIPQELAFVPALSAAENIVIGSWGGRAVVRQRRIRALAQPFADQVGLELDLRTPMAQLSLAQCQLVEIAKALSRRAGVLMLDEPTAALSNAEAGNLFAAVRRLKRQGVAIIYISHRLDEIMTHTDSVVVLRDGAVVAQRRTVDTSRHQLIADMVGVPGARPVDADGSRPAGGPSPAGEPAVALSHVTHRGRGLRDVSLAVHAGEVVGLFGVRGGGQEDVTKLVAGLHAHQAGELVIGRRRGISLRTTRRARRAGVVYVPADRKTQGLILAQGVRQNLTFPQLGRLARIGVMDRRAEQRLLASAAERLSLRYRDGRQPARELSGGNQQKLLLASRIYTSPDVLVIDEPSRGVDVGARAEIHQLLRAVARAGTAVLFTSSDIEECVALSDRLLVFRAGRVTAALSGDDLTEANALDAAGQHLEDA